MLVSIPTERMVNSWFSRILWRGSVIKSYSDSEGGLFKDRNSDGKSGSTAYFTLHCHGASMFLANNIMT